MRQTKTKAFILRGLFAVLSIVILAAALQGAFAATSIRLNPDTTYVDMFGILNMTSNKIVNLDTPTNAADAATKGYVDGKIGSSSYGNSGWNDTGKQIRLVTKTDWVNATTLFINNSNSRVGIGTYRPDYMFHVVGGDAYFGDNVYLGDASTFVNSNGQITVGSGDWIGMGSSAERVVFDGSGNIAIMNAKVGIGTAAPVQELVVVGEANITSNLTMGGAIQLKTKKITGLATPTNDADAATKEYVDTQVTGGASGWTDTGDVVKLTTKTNEVNMTTLYVNNTNSRVGIGTKNPAAKLQITGDAVRIGDSGSPSYATGDGDLYIEDTLEVGGSIRGSGAGITGIPSNAVNDNWVNESGDKMTGILNMTGQRIGEVATPSEDADAATKEYVDDQLAGSSYTNSGWNDIGKQIRLITKTDWVNATTLFINNSNSRVGIGTYRPDYMFHVVGGDAYFGENVYLGDASTFVNSNGQITVGSNDWIGIGSSDERIVFDSSGNIAIMGAKVGIGTAAPVQELVVVGKANITSNLTMGGAIQLKTKKITGLATPTNDADAATKQYVDTQVTSGASGWTDTGAVVKLATKTDEVNMTIMYVNNTNSRVGIGTEAPTQRLSIYDGRVNIREPTSSDYAVLEFGNDATSLAGGFFAAGSAATGYGGASSLNLVNIGAGLLALGTDNSIDMVIKTGGNIGIGTSSPTYRLHVVGNANLNNTLYVNKTSDRVGIGIANPRSRLEVSDGTKSITMDPTATTPTMNTTNNKALIITSSSGNVIVRIG